VLGILAAAAIAAGTLAVPPAGAAAPAAESRPAPVPHWMIGTFIGRNDKYGGRYVELRIYPDGRVTGVVERRLVLDGTVEGDRLVFPDGALRVTRTDEGLTTTEIGDEDNVVFYERF
jgi:hypothetical protein